MLPCERASCASGGQLEKAQYVRDGRSILADLLGDLLLTQVGHLHEPPVGKALFDRSQVFPLNIFNERDLELFLCAELPDDHRDFLKPREPCRAHAPLPRNDEIRTRLVRLCEDGLQDALFQDRIGELPQRLVVELLPRLVRVGLEKGKTHLGHRGRVRSAFIAQQGINALAQRFLRH